MVEINLLPWREEALKYRKKILKRMLFFAVMFAMVFNLLIHVMLSRREQVMRSRIATLNERINHLQSVNKTRAGDHQSALTNTAFIGALFSELGEAKSDRTCFTEIDNNSRSSHFTGRTKSINDLTAFLSHWKAAILFNKIRIKSIEPEENGTVRFVFEGKR